MFSLAGGMPPPRREPSSAALPASRALEAAYELADVLASSASSRVVRAHRREDRQRVVIKQSALAGQDEEELGAAILDEAARACSVRSAHVVGHLGVFLEAGWLHVVCAHAPRGDLASLLARRAGEPLPERMVWRLTGGVLRGLAALHERGLVHGDLKPSNIFLDANGEAMLGDLDLSRSRAQRGPEIYSAPEACTASGREHGAPADVWSAGCVVYRLACGQPPFLAAKPHVLARKISSCEPPELPHSSAQLGLLVFEMLRKSADRRPTAEALLGGAHSRRLGGGDGVRAQPAAPEPSAVDDPLASTPPRKAGRVIHTPARSVDADEVTADSPPAQALQGAHANQGRAQRGSILGAMLDGSPLASEGEGGQGCSSGASSASALLPTAVYGGVLWRDKQRVHSPRSPAAVSEADADEAGAGTAPLRRVLDFSRAAESADSDSCSSDDELFDADPRELRAALRLSRARAATAAAPPLARISLAPGISLTRGLSSSPGFAVAPRLSSSPAPTSWPELDAPGGSRQRAARSGQQAHLVEGAALLVRPMSAVATPVAAWEFATGVPVDELLRAQATLRERNEQLEAELARHRQILARHMLAVGEQRDAALEGAETLRDVAKALRVREASLVQHEAELAERSRRVSAASTPTSASLKAPGGTLPLAVKAAEEQVTRAEAELVTASRWLFPADEEDEAPSTALVPEGGRPLLSGHVREPQRSARPATAPAAHLQGSRWGVVESVAGSHHSPARQQTAWGATENLQPRASPRATPAELLLASPASALRSARFGGTLPLAARAAEEQAIRAEAEPAPSPLGRKALQIGRTWDAARLAGTKTARPQSAAPATAGAVWRPTASSAARARATRVALGSADEPAAASATVHLDALLSLGGAEALALAPLHARAVKLLAVPPPRSLLLLANHAQAADAREPPSPPRATAAQQPTPGTATLVDARAGDSAASAAATKVGGLRPRAARCVPADVPAREPGADAPPNGERARSANVRFHKLMEQAQIEHEANNSLSMHAVDQPPDSLELGLRGGGLPSGGAISETDYELAVLKLRRLRLLRQ